MNWRSTEKWQNNLRYVIWVISFHRHFSSKLIKAHCEPWMNAQHSIKENIFSAENCMSAVSFQFNHLSNEMKATVFHVWQQHQHQQNNNRSLLTTRNVVAQSMNWSYSSPNCIREKIQTRKRKFIPVSESTCYLFIYKRMSLFQFNMLQKCVWIVSTQFFGLFVFQTHR